MSVTGADHLPECVNTKLVWEPGKKEFVKGAVSRAVHLRECPLRELQLYVHLNLSNGMSYMDT